MSTYFPELSSNSIYSKITSLSGLSADTIILYGVNTPTFPNPITATGEFLKIDVNGEPKYIKIFKN
jgi:hypothetical protein